MTAQLETGRLILRPLELADAAQTQVLFPQWEIVRFMTTRVAWPYPPDGALTYYRDAALPAVARGEEWHWTLRFKSEPARLIGAISLLRSAESQRGFWLAPQYHGQGLMTEACEAVTEYWFDVLGQPALRVSKAAANVASRRISEKHGMRLIGMIEADYLSGRQPSEIWEITAEAWRARHAGLHHS